MATQTEVSQHKFGREGGLQGHLQSIVERYQGRVKQAFQPEITTGIEIERRNKLFQEQISLLMKNTSFLCDVASSCDHGYKTAEKQRIINEGQEPETWLDDPLLTEDEKELLLANKRPNIDIGELEEMLLNLTSKTDSEKKSLIQTLKKRNQYDAAKEKLSTNLAGFAALQEGLDFVRLPTENYYQTLDRIIYGKVSSADKERLCRLAHATWYNSQFWRGRYDRQVVKDFDLLPEDEKNKDWRQIVDTAITLKWNLSTVLARPEMS